MDVINLVLVIQFDCTHRPERNAFDHQKGVVDVVRD